MILITACSNDDLNTNQLTGSAVLLRSFGPCPVPRGGELRIIGVNLDQVESVTIPGAPAITDIKRISGTEIRVTVPQTAEVGYITLKAGDKTIKSITEIAYSEPISISKITPASVKAGASIKIEGEYLNLIKEIIFVDGDQTTNHVLQANFVSQSRQAIEVVVPKTAQTGKIIVSDGADLVPEGEDPGIPIWVYSDADLQITLPAFTKLSPDPVKPGSELTITGTNLDLVELLRFGASDIEVSQFTRNSANTEIKVVVPEETQFDATTKKGDVRFVAFSGVEVSSDLKLVAPAVTKVSPEPAKNNGLLTIEGTNLDLVTAVLFAGEMEGEIQSQTAAKIEVIVPATATAGNVVLNTYSGQTAVKAYTLVKPVIASVAPLSLTAGDNLTITGTDLDLVNEVVFKSATGTVSVNLTEAPNSTSFTIRTPFTATKGTISLKTENGTTVTSTQTLTIAEATLPIVTSMPAAIKPGTLLTMQGINLEQVIKIGFVYAAEEVAATRFLPDALGQALQVYVPTTNGTAVIRLYVGDDVYVETPPLKIATTDPIVDPSLVIEDFEPHNGHDATWDNWASNFTIITNSDGNYIQINSGAAGWAWIYGCNHQSTRGNFPSISDPSQYVLKIDIMTSGPIPADVLFNFSFGDWCTNAVPLVPASDGYTTGGEWTTVTIQLSDLGVPATISNGASGDWGMSINNGTIPDGLAIAIDNVRFEHK
ncbi:MAG: glycan-binding surface protein [Candidatus Azobacteroides sp.]|nr:glycan-binding surface protein [Candidatus Azobacteroides sp.]